MATRKHFAFSRTGRSRKGAWIEIKDDYNPSESGSGRSRKGAWIEIWTIQALLNGAGSRSRKGAWIEIFLSPSLGLPHQSLP